jgi:hypothetical protein
MDQLPDGTKYVRAISPIKIPLEGRQQAESKITEDERQSLGGHIGSPQNTQYTPADLARLSNAQEIT